jgi:lipopolysaccharide biosynthesis protein
LKPASLLEIGMQEKTSFMTRLWWHLPLGRRTRQAVKTALFSWSGFLFRNTRPYINWAEVRKLSRSVEFDSGNPFPPHYDLTLLDKKPEAAAGIPELRRVALVIHAFYPDIFGQILSRIESGLGPEANLPVKVFVSTPAGNEAQIRRLAAGCRRPISVEVFPNRGRDVLPFLRLASGIEDADSLVVKLHTKKSNHRLTGELWREELLAGLLADGKIQKALAYFNQHPGVGLIGPAGHVVPMSLYFGGNAPALRFFCQVFGVSVRELRTMNFPAGGMFFARWAALRPLLSLDISDTMFEAEAGQSDGTMAHAIERVFSLSARFQGLTISDTSFPKNDSDVTVTRDHPYTW